MKQGLRRDHDLFCRSVPAKAHLLSLSTELRLGKPLLLEGNCSASAGAIAERGARWAARWAEVLLADTTLGLCTDVPYASSGSLGLTWYSAGALKELKLRAERSNGEKFSRRRLRSLVFPFLYLCSSSSDILQLPACSHTGGASSASHAAAARDMDSRRGLPRWRALRWCVFQLACDARCAGTA